MNVPKGTGLAYLVTKWLEFATPELHLPLEAYEAEGVLTGPTAKQDVKKWGLANSEDTG